MRTFKISVKALEVNVLRNKWESIFKINFKEISQEGVD
jgi:hypothetical protein